MKYLGADVESYRICEWAVKSIQAYKDLHFGNDNTDYSKELTVDEVIDYLANKGISANYNSPMTREQVKRMGESKCRQVYNNIKATHNLVNIMQAKASDLDIVERDKYCYVLSYSFPCQDLSRAGLGKGMAKDSGTRSGLLWEVERLLDECNGNLPQVLLMENVPDVIGTKNVKHFSKWLEKLESIGYKCYWKVLNGKDYGIPQNRERCFMVSILGDYYYEFPQPIKLEKRLKDLLETEVNEKYYLSDNTVNRIQGLKAQQDPLKDIEKEKIISPCLTARGAGEEHSGMILVSEPKCIQVDLQQTVKVRKHEVDVEKLKATLREHKNTLDWSINAIANYLKRPKTEVEHWFRTDNCFSIPDADIWLELKNLLDIETDEFDKPIMEFEIKPNEFDMANRAYHENGLSPTITTQETPKCVQVGMLSGGKWDKMHDQSRRYYSVDGTAPTIPTSCGGNHEPKIAEPLEYIDKPIKAGFIPYPNSNKEHQSNTYYNINGVCPTIDTCGGGNREPKIAEPLAYDEQNQYIRKDGCVGTLTTDGSSPKHNNRIIEPKLVGGIGEKKSNGGTQYYQQDRVYDSNEIAMCHPANLPTGSYNYLVETSKPNNRFYQQAYETFQENACEYGDTIDAFNKRVNKEGVTPTITTRPEGLKTAILPITQNYRIRKLTPKECWRLMGVKDEDFEKVAQNQSNSSLYHLAGDSIITNVLMAIFKQIL